MTVFTVLTLVSS